MGFDIKCNSRIRSYDDIIPYYNWASHYCSCKNIDIVTNDWRTYVFSAFHAAFAVIPTQCYILPYQAVFANFMSTQNDSIWVGQS